MRIFTEKDKKALLAAFRVFIRAMSGERLTQKNGEELIQKALDAGLSVDALFNKENWARAVEANGGGDLSVKDYIDTMAERRIVVRDLREEPMWNEPANGFTIIAEAVHDFFQAITGRGGKWSIPTALVNTSKAVRFYSLQAVLSEQLINQVVGEDEKMFCFGFIQAIVKDYGEGNFSIDTSLTEAQEARAREDEEAVASCTRTIDEKDPEEPEEDENPSGDYTEPEEPEDEAETEEQEEPEEEDDQRRKDPGPVEMTEPEENPDEAPSFIEEDNPEDENYPPETFEQPEEEDDDRFFGGIDPDMDNISFETEMLPADPHTTKRDSIRIVIDNLTTRELESIAGTIEGYEDMPISEIVNALADGRFDTLSESTEAEQVHRNMQADLLQMFIECVTSQGYEMNEELASNYDILHDPWDFRPKEVRMIHKAKKVIGTYGDNDPDLNELLSIMEKVLLSDKQD